MTNVKGSARFGDSTPAITDLAVCRSWIGGGTPVPDPDTKQPQPQPGDTK